MVGVSAWIVIEKICGYDFILITDATISLFNKLLVFKTLELMRLQSIIVWGFAQAYGANLHCLPLFKLLS